MALDQRQASIRHNLSDAGSSQVDSIVASAAVARRRTSGLNRTSGRVKPEVEVGRRGATGVTSGAETWRGGVARSLRGRSKEPVAGENAVARAGVDRGRGRGGGKMAALGVGGLASPLDAPVLEPDFDLCLDQTQLRGQVAPARRPHTAITASAG